MARPIKDTPVLTGKDAAAFADKMKAAGSATVDAKERARIRKNFAKMQAIAKF